MKKNQLNYAQAMLIGAACQIENDKISNKINRWIYRHKLLSGVVFALYIILVSPISAICGFICPADEILDATESAVESAVLSNEAINERNKNEEA